MAKKANTTVPTAPVSEVTEVAPEAIETEATTSAAIDQPAVSDDASASALSPADEPAGDSASPESSETAEPVAPDAPSSPAVEPVVEIAAAVEAIEEVVKAGGGFDNSLFAEPKPAPTMVQRIEALEARVSALEGN